MLPAVQRIRWMPSASSPTRDDWNRVRISGVVVAALGLIMIAAS